MAFPMDNRDFAIMGPDGNIYNDIPASRLRDWLAQGKVNKETLVCPEGEVDWEPLGNIFWHDTSNIRFR